MEDCSRYLGINGNFTLMCCILCVFLPAEGNVIWATVGSRVTLRCFNDTNGNVTHLIWKENEEHLFTFTSTGKLYNSVHATTLKLSMSTLESELYQLIIERAQTAHMGNYTCETSTDMGFFPQKWELIITEKDENPDRLVIIVAVVVPCVCFLIFLFVLNILRRVRHAENSCQSPTVVRQQQRREEIYENCLEVRAVQQRGHSQPNHYKGRAH